MQSVTPETLELSVWICNLGWGYDISIRFWRSGIMFLDVMKSPSISALSAEDIKNLIIWDSVRTGPMSRGIGSYSNSNMKETDRLHALDELI